MAWSMTTQTGDIKQLATLVEVSQTLASTLNLEAALHRVLDILEYHHSMVPSMVTLLHEQSSELAIAVANGLPADGMQARYNVGEGITGRVDPDDLETTDLTDDERAAFLAALNE